MVGATVWVEAEAGGWRGRRRWRRDRAGRRRTRLAATATAAGDQTGAEHQRAQTGQRHSGCGAVGGGAVGSGHSGARHGRRSGQDRYGRCGARSAGRPSRCARKHGVHAPQSGTGPPWPQLGASPSLDSPHPQARPKRLAPWLKPQGGACQHKRRTAPARAGRQSVPAFVAFVPNRPAPRQLMAWQATPPSGPAGFHTRPQTPARRARAVALPSAAQAGCRAPWPRSKRRCPQGLVPPRPQL
jgi:hypothetical protein